MNPQEFDQLVAAAYARIPARFRRRLKNVALIVEPEPNAGQLARGHVPHGNTLLGLYEGRPLTQRSVFEPFSMPDRITIFRVRMRGWRGHLKICRAWWQIRCGMR